LLKIYLSLLIFTFSLTALADYEKPLNWSGNIYKIIKDYNKVHKEFFKKVCVPEDQPTYGKLLTQYRGQGFYLPKLNGGIDRSAIIKNLHHYKKKLRFIDSTISQLEKVKEFPKFGLIQYELDKIVINLLNLKKQHQQALTDERKAKIVRASRIEILKLKNQFKIFTDQVFFLKSFGFPNDYLLHRKNYEKYKDLESTADQKKANQIFFYRKIIEDGAYDPDRSRPDKYIRTALDTLYLNIQQEKDFISENVRYDLEWFEKRMERVLERGKKVHLARLGEWKKRTQDNFKFYQELIQTKNQKKAQFLVKKENDASLKLKKFVYQKQAETYEFWAKKPEIQKALFSLETILVHEVGVIDGEHGLERSSVARVVLNRYYDDFYNKLEKDQQIYKYLNKDIDMEKEKWLNVLFKVGEFSFTYHYIPAVAGIHCPDMSRRGRGIREKNLKIALKAIQNYKGDFKAYRYFSRISMMGKIDMSTVWTDYDRLPEMVGYKSNHQNKLMRYYFADKYQYLYSFVDERGIKFNVVKIDDRSYSVRWKKGSPVFYNYRNPHLFAYFSKKI
jgi:hypothetical protein